MRRVAEPLQQLPRVSVELTHSPITDEAVATLAKVPGLQILFVSLTAVSDRGIVQLAEAERLVMLGATRTRITDASLAEIAKLPRLRVLLVGFNNITDEGLRYLKDCPALEWVHVVNTQVTPEGIAELQQARPHLHIEH